MKKIQAMLVLMIVLAFGGATAQTWAVVAQTLVPPQGVEKWAVPPQGVEWAVLPQGVELSDEKLAQVYGEFGVLRKLFDKVAKAVTSETARHYGRLFVEEFVKAFGTGAGLGAAAAAGCLIVTGSLICQ